MADRLDRYVGKTVLASWLSALAFVVFLWVVVHLLLQMGDYIEAAQRLSVLGTLAVWVKFHLLSLPAVFVTTSPFVTVIGCMFAVARHMGANEVTPMVFVGRSTRRVLAPVLAMGVASMLLVGTLWEFVLPVMSGPAEQLQQVLKGDDDDGALEGIVLMSTSGERQLLIDRYVEDTQRMEGVTLVERGQLESDLAEISAGAACWDPEADDWELVDGVRRSGGHAERQRWLGMSGLTPELVRLSGREIRATALLSYSELSKLLEMSPQRYDLVVAFHYHFTWPLANLVLLLLALPFAVHFERGSPTGRVLFAIAICAAYLVLDLTCQSLGYRGWLQPVVAAWTPTVVFGSLGFVMFGGMRT